MISFLFAFALKTLAPDIGDRRLAAQAGVDLLIPFKCDGKLVLRFDPDWEPIPRRWQLARVTGGSTVAIRDLADLEGHVSLRSSTDALQFVRLKTDPKIGPLIGGARLELLPKSALNRRVFFGQDRLVKGLKKVKTGGWGVVPDHWFKQHHLHLPKVSPVAGGWAVERYVTGKVAGVFKLELLVERVGRNGSYSSSESVVPGLKPPGLGLTSSGLEE